MDWSEARDEEHRHGAGLKTDFSFIIQFCIFKADNSSIYRGVVDEAWHEGGLQLL